MNTYLFSPGAIVATPAALEALEEAKENASVYLHRHLSGDWGEIDEFDKQQNEDALSEGIASSPRMCSETGRVFGSSPRPIGAALACFCRPTTESRLP